MSTGEDVAAAPDGLSAVDRRALLEAAREAIAAHFGGRPPRLPEPRGGLGREQGAFVTLHRRRDGELRGCVGLMRSDEPLVETVARMAVSAAIADRRFEPVSGDELDRLRIEISVLSPLVPIRPEEVVVGRHGLLVSRGGRRGVLLPQVPGEHGWDREAFLSHTCTKAGLPEDAWREPGVELLAFTAEVFSE